MAQQGFVLRRRYLTQSFQLKYTFLLVLFMFLITWLAGYTVYYTAFTMLGEKLANVYPQGRLTVILKAVNITLLLRFALLVPFVVIFSIILSHRVAGPVFRMERYLRDVAQGDFSSPLKLRRNDELQNLAAAVNQLRQNLGDAVRGSKEKADRLAATLEELSRALKQSSDRGATITLAEKASSELGQLKEAMSKYRF